MKCVDYDVDFQRRVSRNLTQWERKPANTQGKRNGKRRVEEDVPQECQTKRQRLSPEIEDDDDDIPLDQLKRRA